MSYENPTDAELQQNQSAQETANFEGQRQSLELFLAAALGYSNYPQLIAALQRDGGLQTRYQQLYAQLTDRNRGWEGRLKNLLQSMPVGLRAALPEDLQTVAARGVYDPALDKYAAAPSLDPLGRPLAFMDPAAAARLEATKQANIKAEQDRVAAAQAEAATKLRNAAQNTAGMRATRLPDGSIFDPKTGVTYSDPRLVPPDVLKEANITLSPVQQQEADNNRKAPAMQDGVQTTVQGNPTAGERANGINSTLPGGNPEKPGGFVPPGPAAPVPPGPAAPVPPGTARRGGFELPRLKVPTVNPAGTASSIFGAYTGAGATAAGGGFQPPAVQARRLGAADSAAGAGPAAVPAGVFPATTVVPTGAPENDGIEWQDNRVAPLPAPSKKGTKFHVMSAGGRGSLEQQGPQAEVTGGDTAEDPGAGDTGGAGGAGDTGGAGGDINTKPVGTRIPTHGGSLIITEPAVTYVGADGKTYVRSPAKTQFVADPRPPAPRQGRAPRDPTAIERDQAAADLARAQAGRLGDQTAISEEQLKYQRERDALDREERAARLEYEKAVNARDFTAAEHWRQKADDLSVRRQNFEEQNAQAARDFQGRQAQADRALRAELGYAESRRADAALGLQGAAQNAQITGYDADGNPTFAREQAVSDTERANLVAQANMGNQAAQIRLAELAQEENRRQFDVQNEQAWRQNPSSVFDRVWNARGGAAPPADASSGDGGFQPPPVAGADPNAQQQQAGGASFLQREGGAMDGRIGRLPQDWQPPADNPATQGQYVAYGGAAPQYGAATAAAAPTSPFVAPPVAGGARLMQAEGGPATGGIGNMAGWTPPPDNPATMGQWQSYGGAAPQQGLMGQATDALTLEKQARALLEAQAAGGPNRSLEALQLMKQARLLNQTTANGSTRAGTFTPGGGAPVAQAPQQTLPPPEAPGATAGEGAPTGTLPADTASPGAYQRGGFGMRTMQAQTQPSGYQGGYSTQQTQAAPAAQAQQGAYQRRPLSYGEINAAGAQPTGIAAVTQGRSPFAMPAYRPSGGVPVVSNQGYNQLTGTERGVFDAELRATGNDPNDYHEYRRRLTAAPVGGMGRSFAAPRQVAAGF